MTTSRFPLAPMSRGIRALTVALLLLPPLLVGGGLGVRGAFVLVWVGALLAPLFAWIFLWWRPGSFAVEPAGLRVEFPVRTRRIAGSQLVGAQPIAAAAVRERLGFTIRVGAGGLWGGFGWLWSRRAGWVELYVSRLDGLVWVERRQGHPMLITPADPERFCEALGRSV